MFERRKEIIDILNEGKIVSKNMLALKLYVNSKTIERDLKVLKNEGFDIIAIRGRNGGYILK